MLTIFSLILGFILASLCGCGTKTDDTKDGRHFSDQADDQSGYQVHAFYVLPSDGPDKERDLDGTIENALNAVNAWFATQTGGPKLRLDTYKGHLDVTFHRLRKSNVRIEAQDHFAREEIESELTSEGLIDPKKLYFVVYEGSSDATCADAPSQPNVFGHVAVLYLQTDVDDYHCRSESFGVSGTEPGYLEFSALHEIVHTLGFVPSCAPHVTEVTHVSDDPNDLMYAGPLPWTPSVLDANHDDYYMANIPGCRDLINSALLDPLPSAPDLPPGW